MRPSTSRKSRSFTPRVSSILSWTLTTTARQPVVWGRLWGELSAHGSAWQHKCLVRPAGQAPHPANNHRLTAAVASPTCAHRKSTLKAKKTVGTWQDRTGTALMSACPIATIQQNYLTGQKMRGATAGRRPANWQELKMDFTVAPRQT